MEIENKDVFRCDNISSVRRFLSLRDVLKLEMFGDEGDDGTRNLESTVQGLKELYSEWTRKLPSLTLLITSFLTSS